MARRRSIINSDSGLRFAVDQRVLDDQRLAATRAGASMPKKRGCAPHPSAVSAAVRRDNYAYRSRLRIARARFAIPAYSIGCVNQVAHDPAFLHILDAAHQLGRLDMVRRMARFTLHMGWIRLLALFSPPATHRGLVCMSLSGARLPFPGNANLSDVGLLNGKTRPPSALQKYDDLVKTDIQQRRSSPADEGGRAESLVRQHSWISHRLNSRSVS
jgi:hypothetical protein